MERGNAGQTGEVEGAGPADEFRPQWTRRADDNEFFWTTGLVVHRHVFVSRLVVIRQDESVMTSEIVVALDVRAGEERWRFQPEEREGVTKVATLGRRQRHG